MSLATVQGYDLGAHIGCPVCAHVMMILENIKPGEESQLKVSCGNAGCAGHGKMYVFPAPRIELTPI